MLSKKLRREIIDLLGVGETLIRIEDRTVFAYKRAKEASYFDKIWAAREREQDERQKKRDRYTTQYQPIRSLSKFRRSLTNV